MKEQSTEWVIARMRSHARRLFWPTLLLLVACAGAGFGYGRLQEEWQNYAVLGAGALVVVLGCVVPYLRWLATSYTITTTRTILRSGVLIRTRQEIAHARVRDVILRRGAIQLMFGTGDVLLDTGGEHPAVLRDVSSPKLVARVIDDLLDDLAAGYPRGISGENIAET